MKKIIPLIIAFVALIACKPSNNSQTNTDTASEKDSIETKILPPLEAGDVFYKKQDPFGKTIELTGRHFEDDTVIFKVRETQMLVKGNQLIYGSLSEQPFMQFDLPSLKFIRYGNARRGQGPDEFLYPYIVPARHDTALLCYVFETTSQKLYKYYPSGKLVPYPFNFTSSKQRKFSDKQLVNIAPDDFIFVETSKTGKSIFRATKSVDSVVTREIYNLALNPKRKSWTNYIGDFAVNPERNRMVYAYKYFKIIKFMDLEAQTVKTVNFEKEEFDESTNYEIDGMDKNVTHYWGASAGEDFVYFLYSGRTPYQVGNELRKNIRYIYVEQYDWNGNPVHKYKLDRWGCFTVDDRHKILYLASTTEDDPFFIYQLAE